MPHAPVTRPADRYGDDAPGRHRTAARLLVALLAVVAVAFFVWVAVDSSRNRVRSTDIGFDLSGPTGEVTVDFQVAMDPGTRATCTLRALNARFAVVGVADVDVEASRARTQRVTGTVLVSEPAVSAGVRECIAR